jgi:protein-S-isoprenylcysteine O-methyltransferase Ste14
MADAATKNGFLERGGSWVLVQFALMTAVIVLALVFQGDWTLWPVIVVGLVLLTVGGWFGIAGVKELGRNRTPFPQPRDGSELVQRGVYKRLRHPLYTSVMLVSVGWAMIWQSWPAFIPALILIPFFHAKARREERWLREKFPSYADYEKRVPRFLPRLRPPPPPI